MEDRDRGAWLARLREPPRKVALLRASRLGDFLLATPALRALRGALPEAEIVLVGLPLVAELAQRSPSLDRFTPFAGFPGIAEQFFDARRAACFFVAMQAENFDLVIQMHGSGRYSNPCALLMGGKRTAGVVRPGEPAGRLDAALPDREDLHEIDRWLALTTWLGAPSQGRHIDLPLWPQDDDAASTELAAAPPPRFGLHPWSRDAEKCWPLEGFLAAGEKLLAQHGGTLVVLGDGGQPALAEALQRRFGAQCCLLDDQIPLGTLGAVVARLTLLLTNDSGPAHMAYALGVPSVTLFGPTSPHRWGPIDRRQHHVVRFTPGGELELRVLQKVQAAAGDLWPPRPAALGGGIAR